MKPHFLNSCIRMYFVYFACLHIVVDPVFHAVPDCLFLWPLSDRRSEAGVECDVENLEAQWFSVPSLGG